MALISSPDIRCQLTEWGLPPLIVGWFKKKGITSLFQWQVECLCKNDVLFGGSLIYSAPTSAGKTLVADFLLLKRVLEYGKKALVIEPFVALTREKAATLKSMLFTTKARVGVFGGTYYTPGGMAAVNVAVCTIEKANNFINKLINENKLSDLGIIVVDEIHYVGDERRGYQLELLLTKVLYHNSLQDLNKRIQIVGLSATIPNLESIATWLRASLYVTGYRPVPLVEKIKIGDRIYDANLLIQDPSCAPLETIIPDRIVVEKDYDDLCYICIDSIINGHSTLVFCESKRECEIMAANLAMQIKFCGGKLKSENRVHADISMKLRSNLSSQKITDVISKLKKCPAGPDKELLKSLAMGVAFHHAGLTTEEREIIEDGFKGGAIKVLMATSTLSSGVNLPARKVIIRSPTMVYSNNLVYQKEMLNPTTYRQMIGRAGRKGIDTSGESILICNQENQAIAIKLIKASLGNISSSLGQRMIASEGEPSGLKKALLEVIANNTAKTRVHLNTYLQSTFWLSKTSKEDEENINKAISETLRYLVTKKFIEELKPGVFKSTRLGTAVLSSGLHPDESLELVQDLIKARQGFCLLNDLHIIYQITPNDIARTIDLKDWQHYSKIWNDLDRICQNVGELVGIDEITIARRCQGFMQHLGDEKERVYRRFLVALVINDLINEMPLPRICIKYRLSKAMVQQAQRAVAQFAGVISIFCNELGYDNIATLITPLESRVNFSCNRDLLDLIRLNITRPIARALFNAGYRNVIALAKGDKLDIDFAIRQIKPFKKETSFNDYSESPPTMWVPELAKDMTTLDYASHIVDAAISLVQIEFDIDIVPSKQKRKGEETSATGLANDDESPGLKKGKLENDVKENMDIPNYVVEYVANDTRLINKFLDRWILHSSISLNFKLERCINKPIGSKIKKEQTASQDGLALTLDIDSTKQIVSRMYACFDDDLTVYIINDKESFKQIRDNLGDFLHKTYSSVTARTATQRREDFTPIKLYTQDITLTYKVLYAAFGLDNTTLNKHFDWHSFDVAWWMINDCPTRGTNNRYKSLSLIKTTKWATKYHHFLYTSSKATSCSTGSSTPSNISHKGDILKFKDIVRAGKTAILQPVINEILVELSKRKQIEAYYEAEIPSRLTMSPMIIHGIGLDMKAVKDELALYDELSQLLTEIAKDYCIKSPITLTSKKDVARVLYEDLDLKKYLLHYDTSSDISKDPTNCEILTILSEYHPFPGIVQNFRKIGTALEALRSVSSHARFNGELNMMRVFGQCEFFHLTGRVAMKDPDLFLINRNFKVSIPAHANRMEELIECAPRRCFIPIDCWIMVAADYSQLELRLMAHFANEENLLDILNAESSDVFKSVASKIYKKPIEEVSEKNRQHAKSICYGLMYGMGNRNLANQLGVNIEKAEEFRNDFFNEFPRICAYTEELVKDCEQVGFVESFLGRRRTIHGINSDNSSQKSRARRQAINTRITSSASDIIKVAMQKVNQKIIENYEKRARLVMEMHDELIYEVDPIILSKFATMLKFVMESFTLQVKLRVNLKKGNNWSNLEVFKPLND